mmetsp:Transcript_16004/g.20916  ORF Transcript_16004/g.20916 Transcript_16004/m.20916 type:complete len:136 (-) Transcript_16004:19-426(-)
MTRRCTYPFIDLFGSLQLVSIIVFSKERTKQPESKAPSLLFSKVDELVLFVCGFLFNPRGRLKGKQQPRHWPVLLATHKANSGKNILFHAKQQQHLRFASPHIFVHIDLKRCCYNYMEGPRIEILLIHNPPRANL